MYIRFNFNFYQFSFQTHTKLGTKYEYGWIDGNGELGEGMGVAERLHIKDITTEQYKSKILLIITLIKITSCIFKVFSISSHKLSLFWQLTVGQWSYVFPCIASHSIIFWVLLLILHLIHSANQIGTTIKIYPEAGNFPISTPLPWITVKA